MGEGTMHTLKLYKQFLRGALEESAHMALVKTIAERRARRNAWIAVVEMFLMCYFLVSGATGRWWDFGLALLWAMNYVFSISNVRQNWDLIEDVEGFTNVMFGDVEHITDAFIKSVVPVPEAPKNTLEEAIDTLSPN